MTEPREPTEQEKEDSILLEIALKAFEAVLSEIAKDEKQNERLHIMVSIISEAGLRGLAGNGCPLCHVCDLMTFQMNTANIRHNKHLTLSEENGDGHVH